MTYLSTILADAPVLLLPLNDATSSTTAADATGSGHTGTLTGGVSVQQPGVLIDSAAMRFDGAVGALSVATLTGLPTGSAHSTLEALIWADDDVTSAAILSYGSPTANNFNGLAIGGGGTTLVSNWDGSSLSSGAVPNLCGAPHHVAATWDGTHRTLYLDGVQVGQDSPAAPAITAANLAIGTDPFTPFFFGTLAMVAVYATALTPTQVTAHAAAFAAEQRPRTVGLYGTALDASGAPSQLATTVQLLVPGAVQALHTASGALVASDPIPVLVDVNGQWVAQVIAPGDLTPPGCQWLVTQGAQQITSPVFSYGTARIAVISWISTSVPAGMIRMYLTALEANAMVQAGASFQVALNADALWTGTGGVGQLIVGLQRTPLVVVDPSGTVAWYLIPQASLNPSTGFYLLQTLTGQLSWTCPAAYTNDQGAWLVGTAYTAGQVVEVAGIPYLSILAGTGHAPASSPTYWAPYLGERITAHLVAVGASGSIALSADNVLPASGFTPVAGAPYPTPGSLTQDILDLHYAAQHTVPAYAWLTETANYTATAADRGILVDATGGAVTITLPTAAGSSARLAIKKKDSSGNTVTIATTSGQTIDGASTKVISAQNAGYEVYSDGANWFVVAIPFASGGGGGTLPLLASHTVSGSTETTITLAIPNTATSLIIQMRARSTDTSVVGQDLLLQMNGDTGSNYSWVTVRTDGGTASYDGAAGVPAARLAQVPTDLATAGLFAVVEASLPFYNDATITNNIVSRYYAHYDTTDGQTGQYGGAYQVAAAITSLTFSLSAGDFEIGTNVSVFGIGGPGDPGPTGPAGPTGPTGPAGGGMTNPMSSPADLIIGGAAGAPGRLGIGANGQVLSVVAGAAAWAAGGSGGALTTAAALLGSDQALGTSTWTDIVSITLAAGTWLIFGQATILPSSSAFFEVRIWDGTTTIVSGESATFSAAIAGSISVGYVVTPSGSTTYRLAARADGTSGTAKAAVLYGGVGNNACAIWAVKVG